MDAQPPRRWRLVAAIAAIAIPVVALLAYGLTRDPRALPSPLVGRQAPDFSLRLFDGRTLQTGALRGRVLVVNFWASWCYPACYEEAPDLQRVWDEYRSRGVTVIGVNIQDQDGPARAFVRRFRQTFPNGADRTGQISIDFGVYGVPETFIIDRDGRIAAKRAGAVSYRWLTDTLTALRSP